MSRGFFTTLFLTLFTVSVALGQDSQYSQFYAHPVYSNPSFVGAHSGTYRVTSGYRSQWAGALENPFTSFSLAGDFKINLNKSKKSSDYAGAGIIFNTDQIGFFNYDIYHIALMGGYHKLLNPRSNTYLSGGFLLGLQQRSLNYNNVTFQDQFNGADAFSGATNENLPANNIAHSDIGFGLNFSTTPAKNLGFYLGASYYHLNQPRIGFFTLDNNSLIESEDDFLWRRLSVHTAVSIPLSDLLTLLPRAIYNQQGPHSSITAGSNLRFQIYEADASFFHFGAWMRSTKSLTTFQPTDATLFAGFEMRGLMLGFSYDFYIREVAGEVGTGTFEFVISYTGSHENSIQICPSF